MPLTLRILQLLHKYMMNESTINRLITKLIQTIQSIAKFGYTDNTVWFDIESTNKLGSVKVLNVCKIYQ